MKNLLLVLLTIPLMFGSCKKDDDNEDVIPVVPESSNTWTKTFGGTELDWGSSVQQTTDGGYIIIGGTYSFGNGEDDVYLIKTDGNGDSLWTKTFGGTEQDLGSSVQQTTDGGYIITGRTSSYGSGLSDTYLIRLDENGDSLWTKTFIEFPNTISFGECVKQTTDGGFIITGYSNSLISENISLIKIDENGLEEWYVTLNGGHHGYSVQQTTDGGFVVTGNSNNVCLIKTDESGVEQWTKIYYGNGIIQGLGYCVQQTTDGGFIITGMTNYQPPHSVFLIKTDENGDSLWTKTFGGTDTDVGNSVQQTTDGGYIITGGTSSFGNSGGNSGGDVYLIKTDGNGDSLWTKTFGGTEQDLGSSVQQTIDGGYIITGRTESFGNGNSDIYLIKTDENGDVTP